MKLRFGILWVEDSLTLDMKQGVERSALAAGFEVRLKQAKTRAEIRNCSVEQEKYHLYDLVLIDWDLGDFKGDEIIKEIRKMFSFTPILFYSAQISTNELRLKIFEREIEGVFCSNRERLSSKTAELIANFAKPLDQLSGMRGLGAQVVAEMDELYQQMIIKLISDNEEKEMIATMYLKTEIENQISKISESIEKFPDIGSFLNAPITDSMKLFKLFRHLLKDYISSSKSNDVIAEINVLNNDIKEYGTDILGVRNILSHALEEQTEDGWVITDKKGNEISSDQFSKFRTTFIEYLDNLKRLNELLK